ncbi:MAG: phosphopantothenoylcysteine decarboxylase [Lysobacteraceae bacterium]|nr:MAG: phosphopantothenoylcysteine decarboxylase [Xanthomonadaceae bacterium]
MASMAAAERIVLGVSGGIAAYKSAELVRRLRERGHEVQVVMTEAATRFVTPLTFQALSGRPVRCSLWDDAAEAAMGHIELARWAQRVVVAPASADLIARMAQGRADDLLTTLLLATAAPVLLAPAMNRQMWAHPAVQANLEVLRSRGIEFVGPGRGGQACGEFGEGRMSEPAEILARLAAPPAAEGRLRGRRVLITAGPTFEDIDPVRFIGNRSSGRMGFAVAEAACAEGAEVTLVAGPVSLPTPAGVRRIDVRSACQMRDAVMQTLDGQDVFIAAAAVADYRPREVLDSKRKKSGQTWNLELVLNPDILAEVAARTPRPFVVGFAAETEEVERHARDKLARKRLDMIAANRVGQPGCGFEAGENALSVYWHGGGAEIPLADKSEVAARLVALIAERMGQAG